MMAKGSRLTILWFGCLIGFYLAGCGGIAGERSFEHDAFTFRIPNGWETMEEVWDRPAVGNEEHYGLGVQRIVMIQYPPKPGKGKAFFAVATSLQEEGQALDTRFKQAYENADPAIESAEERVIKLADRIGYEITYQRPWGEPRWWFRDVWLENAGVIYVLSFHAPPTSFQDYDPPFAEILESFRFKE